MTRDEMKSLIDEFIEFPNVGDQWEGTCGGSLSEFRDRFLDGKFPGPVEEILEKLRDQERDEPQIAQILMEGVKAWNIDLSSPAPSGCKVIKGMDEWLEFCRQKSVVEHEKEYPGEVPDPPVNVVTEIQNWIMHLQRRGFTEEKISGGFRRLLKDNGVEVESSVENGTVESPARRDPGGDENLFLAASCPEYIERISKSWPPSETEN